MTRDEFAHYHRIWSDYIRRTARRKARGRRYLADDLEQATLCMLWELDLSGVRGNASSFIRGAICTCMRSVIRAERRGGIIPAWTPTPVKRLQRSGDPVRVSGARGEWTCRRAKRRTPPVAPQPRRVPRHPNWAAPHQESP